MQPERLERMFEKLNFRVSRQPVSPCTSATTSADMARTATAQYPGPVIPRTSKQMAAGCRFLTHRLLSIPSQCKKLSCGLAGYGIRLFYPKGRITVTQFH